MVLPQKLCDLTYTNFIKVMWSYIDDVKLASLALKLILI